MEGFFIGASATVASHLARRRMVDSNGWSTCRVIWQSACKRAKEALGAASKHRIEAVQRALTSKSVIACKSFAMEFNSRRLWSNKVATLVFFSTFLTRMSSYHIAHSSPLL